MNNKRRISLIPFKQQVLSSLFLSLAILLFVFSWHQLHLNLDGCSSNLLKASTFIRQMLWMDISEWRDVLTAAGQSLSVAVLATIISALLGFLVSFAAAANVSHHWLVLFCKSLAAGIRAVPTLIWTLIFVAYLGLGPFPGVLGLCFHSFAYLVKAFSQSIEEVSLEKLEALNATGASWVQTMAGAVFPSIQTALISWTALRFEFNVGMSTVLGLVGAGGVGHELTLVMRSYAFAKAGFVILIIFLMSFGIEMTFHKLKINVDQNKLNTNCQK